MKLISKNEDIKALCNKLSKQKFICVDTEFIREKYYYAKLCLLQLGDSKGNGWILDPLKKNIDLKPVYSIFFNPKILKVFHAPRQDLEIVYNLTNKIPNPIFDTQSAGMACGHGDSISYEKLVKDLMNIEIDKSTRHTDWSNRPLNKRQLDYALKDVTHLSKIYLILNKKINDLKRSTWIKEEIEKFYDPNLYKNDPYLSWKKINIRKKNTKDLKIIREIAALREKIAIKKNIQRNMVLKDEHIVKIALNSPQNMEELYNIRSLPFSKISKALKFQIIESVNTGITNSDLSWIPKTRKLKNSSYESIIELLYLVLKNIAHQNKTSIRLIATKSDIEDVVSGKKENKLLKGWRYKIFGKIAVKISQGKIAISYKNNKIILKEI